MSVTGRVVDGVVAGSAAWLNVTQVSGRRAIKNAIIFSCMDSFLTSIATLIIMHYFARD